MTADLVFRDISRAFDKVWHYGLEFKLRTAQLPDTCLTRKLSNYLADRTETVGIGDYSGKGTAVQLKSGVPQAGYLSTTLFNFYTHWHRVYQRNGILPFLNTTQYFLFTEQSFQQSLF